MAVEKITEKSLLLGYGYVKIFQHVKKNYCLSGRNVRPFRPKEVKK